VSSLRTALVAAPATEADGTAPGMNIRNMARMRWEGKDTRKDAKDQQKKRNR